MARWLRLAVTAVFVALAMFGSLPAARADGLEDRVVELTNAERARQGLPALVGSPELTLSAQRYAQAMAAGGFFGHQSPDGSTLVTRAEAAGYRGWTYLAENLAAGQASSEGAMDGWMKSDGHRANVLSPKVREIGVGHVYVPGSKFGHYWVQEFGNRPLVATVLQQQALPQPPPAPAPQPAPAFSPAPAPAPGSWTAPTGHAVDGGWLAFLRANGDVDNLGLPRTGVIADPTAGGQTVQYFQRMILEYHPENSPAYRIQRRLLGDVLYPGADAPISIGDAPPGPWRYFPFSPDRPTGLGHFVADYTRSSQPIYFKQYFDSHGGVTAFGYPKEEPKLRDGRWVQRFQAAVFEYHPENDRDGVVPGTSIPLRTYRVQLELLGDKYIAQRGLPYR
ncbi:MAG: CAP domain-containing protein [Chloroflexi bacterium]|nr:CAP domain-containing protein [Chloroflexota bacterium]